MNYKVTDLIENQKDAINYMVKTAVNSVASDLTPLKLNAAGIIDKIDGVLGKEEHKEILTSDQVFDLAIIRTSLLNLLKVIDDNSKNI
jgi:hypothetical protein